jgi:hypothetical protein
MKDMIIKNKVLILIVLLLGVAVVAVIKYRVVDDSVVAEGKKKLPPQQKLKELDIEKDQQGNYIVKWETFKEYDSEKREPGEKLRDLIGQKITLKGFMIPIDYSVKMIKEFLLVPYMPSCSHVPPPPENMIINVSLDNKGVESSYQPVKVSGRLRFEKGEQSEDPYSPNGVFSMKATSVKEVEN